MSHSLFINGKDKVGYFLRKYQILQVNYCKIVGILLKQKILLKHVRDHLSLLFQFAWVYFQPFQEKARRRFLKSQSRRSFENSSVDSLENNCDRLLGVMLLTQIPSRILTGKTHPQIKLKWTSMDIWVDISWYIKLTLFKRILNWNEILKKTMIYLLTNLHSLW